MSFSQQKHVAFIAGYGDPLFDHWQQVINRGTGAHTKLQGIYYYDPIAIANHSYTIPTAYIPRVHDWCEQGDPVCNWSFKNGKACVLNLATCPHMLYVDNGDILAGAGWAAKVLHSLPPL